MQGYYYPKNPEKYTGSSKTIIFRSSYELIMFIILDINPSVLKWNSESIKIKYFNPIDKKVHSYYPDVYFEKIVDGSVVRILGEVKGESFLKKPIKPNTKDIKKYRSYIKKMHQFVKIVAKKQAAEKFCKEKGIRYEFFSESFFSKYDLEGLMKMHSIKPKINKIAVN